MTGARREHRAEELQALDGEARCEGWRDRFLPGPENAMRSGPCQGNGALSLGGESGAFRLACPAESTPRVRGDNGQSSRFQSQRVPPLVQPRLPWSSPPHHLNRVNRRARLRCFKEQCAWLHKFATSPKPALLLLSGSNGTEPSGLVRHSPIADRISFARQAEPVA